MTQALCQYETDNTNSLQAPKYLASQIKCYTWHIPILIIVCNLQFTLQFTLRISPPSRLLKYALNQLNLLFLKIYFGFISTWHGLCVVEISFYKSLSFEERNMTEMKTPDNLSLEPNGNLAEELGDQNAIQRLPIGKKRTHLGRRSPKLRLATSNVKPTLSILGLGYVGAVSSACFSDLGFSVIGVDPDLSKVECISKGKSPIVEKDLGKLLNAGCEEDLIQATDNTIAAVLSSEVTLISVGTPSDADGSCDLQYLRQACAQIGEALRLKTTYHLIVMRSTIPPGTTRNTLVPIIEKVSGKKSGKDFGVCFNPEFLRESTAVEDFFFPPITVLGAIDDRSMNYAAKLYEDVDAEIIQTSLEAAEFVKYVDNTWHALKVSFGNEVGRLCKAANVDSHEVMNIFCKDTKLNISSYYLKPDFAYGGSCLPKDTRGINHLANSLNVDLPIISNIPASNDCHIEHAMDIVGNLDAKNIGLVGITFKAGTDDLRESPAIELIKRLTRKGYKVKFFDPCITSESFLDKDPLWDATLKSSCVDSEDELLNKSDALIVTHSQPYAEEIVRNASPNMHVIDVVRLKDDVAIDAIYQGIGW